MYFPLIVHEALMVEPCETESKDAIDEACEIYLQLHRLGYEDPQALHSAPSRTPVGRLDEVAAARTWFCAMRSYDSEDYVLSWDGDRTL